MELDTRWTMVPIVLALGYNVWAAKKQGCEQRDIHLLWFFFGLSVVACVAIVAFDRLFPHP